MVTFLIAVGIVVLIVIVGLVGVGMVYLHELGEL